MYTQHLVNRFPSSAIGGKTPLEVWSGKPATDYDTLHVFGSTAYYHATESKLDPRAKKALPKSLCKAICYLIFSFNIPLSSFSLIKNLSISMCLVLSCCTGLLAMLIADLFSDHSLIWFSWFIFHNISATPTATALYSLSAIDLATTDCFLLFQETRFPPTNMQYPDVDFLSSAQLAQSESQLPSILKWPCF